MSTSAIRPGALALALIASCGAPGGPTPVVAVAPIETAQVAHGVGPGGLALEPVPRPGSARRFIRLSTREPGSAPVRVSLDMPAAWGMRVREAGGRALRPCHVSPSSPGELFLLARSRCDSGSCNDHEKLAEDLVDAGLADRSQVDSSASETLAPGIQITRITGGITGLFTSFRVVRVDPQSRVPVACEAFLFGDEVALQPAYESACRTLRVSPEDWQEGPEEIAAAPGGEVRPQVEDSIAQSAVGYISALASRDAQNATLFLLTASECIASGGDAGTCEAGMNDRKSALARSLDAVLSTFLVGAADVRYPKNLPGLAIATVKRKGDPCGPGYEVTLARGQGRYAIVSPQPAPDPKLATAPR